MYIVHIHVVHNYVYSCTCTTCIYDCTVWLYIVHIVHNYVYSCTCIYECTVWLYMYYDCTVVHTVLYIYVHVLLNIQCTNYILCTLFILHVHVHVHAVGRSIELTTEISSTRTRIT